jgi:hypothetical protein
MFGKRIEAKLDGVIAFDFDNGKLIPKEIYGYDFNYWFNQYLKAVIAEDAEIKKIFITDDEKNEVYSKASDELIDLLCSEDIEGAKDASKRMEALDKSFSNPDVNWSNIINSVLEFLILMEIGRSLSEYNYSNEINKKWYREYTRDDCADSVFQNKVIDIITKDPCKRDVLNSGHGNGIVCISRGDFIHFPILLDLPLKSRIFRNKHNILTIDTKYYTIQIVPRFQGMGIGKLIKDFLMEENGRYNPYEANIKLVIVKKGGILKGKKTRYALNWLDDLLKGMYKYVSFKTFEQEINLKGLIVLKQIVNDILVKSSPVRNNKEENL